MIDRQAVVTRHTVLVRQADPLSPLSVGNGQFVFTADVTGLQTLTDFYASGPGLHTMAAWGWNAHANTTGVTIDDTRVDVDTYGRVVPYPIHTKTPSADYLRANPHQCNLGQIGLVMASGIVREDVMTVEQDLNLWHGHLHSRFALRTQPVSVETVCHSTRDAVSVRIVSPLIADGTLGIALRFPFSSATWGRDPSDWEQEDRHVTHTIVDGQKGVRLQRKLDTLAYHCGVQWQGNARWEQKGAHAFELWSVASSSDILELTVVFSPDEVTEWLPDFETIQFEVEAHWHAFWQRGGVIDLSASKDARWQELERRVVLSQYVTAIQSCNELPPQETGLTCNSWFGKFHLEMHWWHIVHFALWGRIDLMEKSLGYYVTILDRARETAMLQGYNGARWPKMVGPDGHESPSPVGPMLIWQQPHPIYYAELCYRAHQDQATLERYRDIVFETADFMASYAHWDGDKGCFDLGPPLIPAQENHRYAVTKNPVYELEYWHWALSVAQSWRERLGLKRDETWDHVLTHLAPMPIKDGLYVMTENRADGWEDSDLWRDHPSFLAALGVLPGHGVDRDVMKATLQKTCEVWDWARAWGWDFPVAAMCAARLGEGDLAIDLLLLDVVKNRYLDNGHNFQAERLPLYLPGNGGLLTAVAMMAAGWDGAPDVHAPGFPQSGQWVVQWEGLDLMP